MKPTANVTLRKNQTRLQGYIFKIGNSDWPANQIFEVNPMSQNFRFGFLGDILDISVGYFCLGEGFSTFVYESKAA